jgi:lysozyme
VSAGLPGFDGVIDLSHHQRVIDWATIRAAGIVAVIHKATEGTTLRDPAYAERRAAARAAGLLWGSYHYAGTSPVADQVDNYLAHAAPRGDELVCLDYEAGLSGAVMDPGDLLRFVELLHARLGRWPVLYGGQLLALAAAELAAAELPASVLARCPLWLARYGDTPPDPPPPWRRWTFWQYTDGIDGPEPHTVPGIGPCDRNVFNGTREEVLASWPFGI